MATPRRYIGRTRRPTASTGPECGVAVNEDCRHYIMQTTRGGEKLQRCKMDANEPFPFACPDGFRAQAAHVGGSVDSEHQVESLLEVCRDGAIQD